jgi:ABC-type amino acid transport substrate-binding protein
MSPIPVPRTLLAVLLMLAAASCVTPGTAPGDVVSELAPNGSLRAAIAANDPVSIDVARELAKRLGVPLLETTFDAPFDIAFALPEAARARQLDFTEPYLVLDGRPRVIAVARGRPEAGDYLRDFVDELQASGFIATAIDRHGAKARASAP